MVRVVNFAAGGWKGLELFQDSGSSESGKVTRLLLCCGGTVADWRDELCESVGGGVGPYRGRRRRAPPSICHGRSAGNRRGLRRQSGAVTTKRSPPGTVGS